MASSEQDKRLRAELAEGLGYFPASLAAEDVARYRKQIAERKARAKAGERKWVGSGRIQVAQVGSPQGRTASHRDRSSGTRIGGRPVRVSYSTLPTSIGVTQFACRLMNSGMPKSLCSCLERGLELNQSAHHCRPMMCRWRLVWVLLGLTSNSKL